MVVCYASQPDAARGNRLTSHTAEQVMTLTGKRLHHRRLVMNTRTFKSYIRRVVKSALTGNRDAIRTLGALTLSLIVLHEPHRHCKRKR